MSDTEPEATSPPPLILPLPGLVWAVVLALAGAEALYLAGAHGLAQGLGATGAGWRLEALEQLGFSAGVQRWMWQTRQFPPEHLLRYLGFVLVHPGPAETSLSVVLLAALGKFAAQGFGRAGLAVLLIVPPATGAAVFGILSPGPGVLIGALPMVMGLVGAFTLARWHQAGQNRRARVAAFGLIGSFLLLRLVLGVLAEPTDVWIAELAAFAAGFGLAMALRPGAAARVLARLRAH